MADQKSAAFWSRSLVSRFYRSRSGGFYAPMHRHIATQIANWHSHDVLDIACGAGDFLDHLSKVDPSITLSGVDIAPGMVDYAKAKLGERAQIEQSLESVPDFPPESFDVITIMMAFHHFESKISSLKKIKILLKPQGKLIIADVVAKSDFQKKFWNWLERLTGIRGFIEHYTEADIGEIAPQAGFSLRAEAVPRMATRYRILYLSKNG